MRRIPAFLVTVGLLAGGSAGGARAAAPEPEYEIKARMLVELLSYVQWPADSDPAKRAVDIVVVGKSPFGAHLDNYARIRALERRPVRIRYLAKAGDPGSCAAVFVCRSEVGRADALMAWARSHQVLTVADDEAMARRGVMVNLLMERQYVRLAVNANALSAAGISLSSRLLRNARMLPSSPTHP
jgi:hypothetical protein